MSIEFQAYTIEGIDQFRNQILEEIDTIELSSYQMSPFSYSKFFSKYKDIESGLNIIGIESPKGLKVLIKFGIDLLASINEEPKDYILNEVQSFSQAWSPPTLGPPDILEELLNVIEIGKDLVNDFQCSKETKIPQKLKLCSLYLIRSIFKNNSNILNNPFQRIGVQEVNWNGEKEDSLYHLIALRE